MQAFDAALPELHTLSSIEENIDDGNRGHILDLGRRRRETVIVDEDMLIRPGHRLNADEAMAAAGALLQAVRTASEI